MQKESATLVHRCASGRVRHSPIPFGKTGTRSHVVKHIYCLRWLEWHALHALRQGDALGCCFCLALWRCAGKAGVVQMSVQDILADLYLNLHHCGELRA